MKFYRFASPAPAIWNLIKTIILVGGFWAFIAATAYEVNKQTHSHHRLDFFLVEPMHAPGYFFFGASVLLGLYAALTVVFLGKGTPMPFDAPRKLVTRGPYARMRNPLLVAAIGQGLAATVYTGALLILPCVVGVVIVAQGIVSSTERGELERSFGRDFEAFRRSVPYWIPRWTRWTGLQRDTPPISLGDINLPNRRRNEEA